MWGDWGLVFSRLIFILPLGFFIGRFFIGDFPIGGFFLLVTFLYNCLLATSYYVVPLC